MPAPGILELSERPLLSELPLRRSERPLPSFASPPSATAIRSKPFDDIEKAASVLRRRAARRLMRARRAPTCKAFQAN